MVLESNDYGVYRSRCCDGRGRACGSQPRKTYCLMLESNGYGVRE
jgi:hypothetical protein